MGMFFCFFTFENKSSAVSFVPENAAALFCYEAPIHIC